MTIRNTNNNHAEMSEKRRNQFQDLDIDGRCNVVKDFKQIPCEDVGWIHID